MSFSSPIPAHQAALPTPHRKYPINDRQQYAMTESTLTIRTLTRVSLRLLSGQETKNII